MVEKFSPRVGLELGTTRLVLNPLSSNFEVDE